MAIFQLFKSFTLKIYAYNFLLLGLIEMLGATNGIKDKEISDKLHKKIGKLIIGYSISILPACFIGLFFPSLKAITIFVMGATVLVVSFILIFKIGPTYHENVKIVEKRKKNKK